MKTVFLWSFVLFLWVSLITGCSQEQNMSQNSEDYAELREEMIQRQIVARGVKDSKVIDAMRQVPRHRFVPQRQIKYAYQDEPRPIGEGQTISQPYIVAFMTEQLQLESGDRVLEIGTGSGYQSAVLANLVDSVFTIEIIPELGERAGELLSELQYDNVVVKIGDGYQGWEEKSPFDAIIVTAAPPTIPPPLLEQLKVGGRMIIPVGEYYQELVVVNKTETGLEMKDVLPVRFVPMTGEVRQ